MANTYREQAEDRFTRSLAFMSKAESLLQDDLINRSALADAVSAIKNMLQGYLLLRVSQVPQSGVTQRWQEIAVGNSMPDLIQCCGDAGLNLAGLAYEIKQLNRERNTRMHDDPARRIDTQQARKALDLALNVQKRIKAAVRGETAAEPSSQPAAVQRIAAVTRATVSGRLNRDLLRSVTGSPPSAPAAASSASPDRAVRSAPIQPAAPETPPTAATAASPTPTGAYESSSSAASAVAADSAIQSPEPSTASNRTDDTIGEDGDGDAEISADTSEHDAFILPLRRGRRGLGFVLLRAVAVAALLIVGVVAGAGMTVPVVEGHAPTWLAFATNLLPATPTPASPVPTAIATATPQSGPLFAGGFMVEAPACSGSGTLALALHNAATTPALWVVASPDGTGATFTAHPGANGTPTLSGTLASGASVTLYVANASGAPYHVVVVAPAGAIQLLAPAC